MFLSLALGIILCGTAFFLLFTYLRIIKKGESITGEIFEIDDGSFTVKGSTFHSIWVQYIGQDETVQQMRSINGFILTPFREKHKLSKLRKKHLGKMVHGYLLSGKCSKLLLREFMWKNWILCLFLLLWGLFLLLLGIFVLL